MNVPPDVVEEVFRYKVFRFLLDLDLITKIRFAICSVGTTVVFQFLSALLSMVSTGSLGASGSVFDPWAYIPVAYSLRT